MAVGNAGRVLETIDSGQSWYLIDSPTNVGFRDVQCFSPTHAILTSWDLITIEYKQTPLPIAISSFAGTAETFSVDLSWAIQDEATIKSFRIVRSDASWRTRTFDGIAATVRYYLDTFVLPETRYEYTLIAMDGNGNEVHSAPITMMTSSAELALLPNVPNPFNPSTTIRYFWPSRIDVRVTIYDVAGRAVITLVDREESAGQYSVPWNGTDANGDHVASGVYLVRIEAGKQSLARKMVMLK